MRRPSVLVLALAVAAVAAPVRSETYYSNGRIEITAHVALPSCPIAYHGYEQQCEDAGASLSAITPFELDPPDYRPPEGCEMFAEGHSFPLPASSVGGCSFADGRGNPGPIGVRLTDEPTPLPGSGCRAWSIEFDEGVAASRLFFIEGLSGSKVRSGYITSSFYQRTPAGDLWGVRAYIQTRNVTRFGTSEITFELGGVAFSPSNCDAGDEIGELTVTLEGYATGAWTT